MTRAEVDKRSYLADRASARRLLYVSSAGSSGQYTPSHWIGQTAITNTCLASRGELRLRGSDAACSTVASNEY